MRIDGHFHVWPDSIARQALAGAPTELKRFGDGTIESAVSVLERAGIDRAVCLGVAPTADRVEAANKFAASLTGRLIGFGSIHPDLSVEDNLNSLRRHGLKGVKIHPVFQNFRLDDPRLWSIFEAMEDRYVVVAHAGTAGRDHGGDRCTPRMVANVVRNFPKLRLIACHLGGYQLLDEVEREIIGLPVYLDLSWPPSFMSIEPKRARGLIEKHGIDRVCFASDWPMADPAVEVRAIESLGFEPDVTRAILGGTLQRLLGESFF